MNQRQALDDLQSENVQRVVLAAEFLSGVPESRQELLRLLAHERRLANRHGILYALTWRVNPDDWELMIRILGDEAEHSTVRGQAAEALAHAFDQHVAGTPAFDAAVRAVIEATHSPEPEVRYCAANTLGATRHRVDVFGVAPLR